jgi:hypothetical protein
MIDREGTNQTGGCLVLLWKLIKWAGELQGLCGLAGQRNTCKRDNQFFVFWCWVRLALTPAPVAMTDYQLSHVLPLTRMYYNAASLDGYS